MPLISGIVSPSMSCPDEAMLRSGRRGPDKRLSSLRSLHLWKGGQHESWNPNRMTEFQAESSRPCFSQRPSSRKIGAAEEFIAKGAWVSLLVLAETIGARSAVYDVRQPDLATAIEMFLNHQHPALHDSETVALARALPRQARTRLSGCLMLEVVRRAEHLPPGTFGRDLSKLDGAQRL